MSKYKNIKCKVGTEVFDSRREADRYLELCYLQKAGIITDLARQVKFVLIPAQREKTTGTKCGRVIEREVAYIADFVYIRDGQTVVEDAKGVRTRDYVIKRKLMLYMHGIRIAEV